MNNKKKSYTLLVETIIIITIAICMIFLNIFTTKKLVELDESGTEAMFIKEDLIYPKSDQLKEEIIKYRPNSCKMVEMYDDSFTLLFSLNFDKDNSIIKYNINEYPDLIEFLENNKEGQTMINIGEYNEEIYFKWITTTDDERRLIIIYSTKKVVDNIWVFSFVSYMVIILIFILLIRIHIRNYRDKINLYKNASCNFRDEINRR